ncbi:MAG: hypothetical protein AAGF94_02670 [Pseudomonadota bacterium]
MTDNGTAPGKISMLGYGLVILIIVAASFAAGKLGFSAVSSAGVSLADLGKLLVLVLFLAILIERGVELILSSLYGAEEIAIQLPLREALARNKVRSDMLAQDLELLVNPQDRMLLVEDAMGAESEAIRQGISDKAANARLKLEDLRRRKKHSAILWSCLLGAAVSLSGFQLLKAAFSPEFVAASLPATQLELFQLIDIGVTTIVLAGVAEAVHQLLNRVLALGTMPKNPVS